MFFLILLVLDFPVPKLFLCLAIYVSRGSFESMFQLIQFYILSSQHLDSLIHVTVPISTAWFG